MSAAKARRGGVHAVFAIAGTLAAANVAAATIDVRIEQAAGGTPVPGLAPVLHRIDGAPVAPPVPVAAGRWRFEGVAAGAVQVCAQSADDPWIGECHGDQHLPFTDDPGAITPLELEAIASLEIVLRLDRGGTLTGIVSDRHRDAALADARLELTLFDFPGSRSRTLAIRSGADGRYAVAGLPPGAYRLQMHGVAPHYTPMRYPGIDCIAIEDCLGNSGSYVGLNGTAVADNLGFELFPGAVLRGSVQQAGSGLPLSGVAVHAWQAGATGLQRVASATSTGDGTYELAHVPPGAATRLGSDNFSGFLDRGWPDAACASPDCTGGTSFVPAHGVAAGYGFALPRGRGIAGTLTVAATPSPAPGATIDVYRVAAGPPQLAWTGTVSPNAAYATRGFEAGTYYVRARLDTTAADCLDHAGVDCPAGGGPPDPQRATPIVLPAAATDATGIDFLFRPDAMFGDGYE